MVASPDISPALLSAYVATFAKPPQPYLQIVHFSNPEVGRYNFHGIAGIKIVAQRHSAVVGAIVDLQPLQTPQEQERGWMFPISTWVSRYHPESFTIYVASGKQPIPRRALRFDESRVCEGLVISLNFDAEHRMIPYTAGLIPIYSPRAG